MGECGGGGRGVGSVGESGGGWGRGKWVITKGIIFLFLRLYPLKCAKICVRDTLRLSRSRLFEDCRVFAHGVIKILSRRMREDAKTRKRSRLPSSGVNSCLDPNVFYFGPPIITK